MAKGENIFRRRDGRWEARYSKGRELSGKIKYGYCYGKTYREAKEKAEKCKAALASGNPLPTSMTPNLFSAYCMGWLHAKKSKVKESTYIKYSTVVEKHIIPKLGDCCPLGFTTELMDDFIRELQFEDELAPKTVHDILVVLHGILKFTASKCKGVFPTVEINYPKIGKKEMRVLSREEQARFISYLQKDLDPCRFGILLALCTGIRIGELCALRWEYVSTRDKAIKIVETLQRLRDTSASQNTGQLPMYLIENHHEGIVSREKYDAVQAEMARRNAAKSPSKNAVTGMASYASKYALSERLVCGECGTLYRRCTWTRNGEKRVVWRCVSRLDYGKKYCHNSPTLDEAPLQQAILAALNMAMADKNSLIRQITDAMETEIIPFPGGTMSLGDIERRLRELEQQFQTLLEKATDDPAAYGGQFKEILDEQTFLKEKRSGILADNNEQTKANQRIKDAAQTLENASPHITEWDESAIRQLVETVKVLSKDEIAVTLKGGIEICQKIMY